MSRTIRPTAAQALVRYLGAQLTEDGEPFIAGVRAIFGHGNVAAHDAMKHGAESLCVPTDQQVIGAVQRAAGPDTVVMSAAGTMPGEQLHKLWKATRPISYRMKYGYSCTGYEIAGALDIETAVVIDTDPCPSTPRGGHWWNVVVPEVSERAEADAARSAYETKRGARA